MAIFTSFRMQQAAGNLGGFVLRANTRGIWAGAFYFVYQTGLVGSNIMEYLTLASTGNLTDFGDLVSARGQGGGAGSSSRGVLMGGSGQVDQIDYRAIASTGNASDFGNLTQGREYVTALSDETRAIAGGGTTGASNTDTHVNTMDYITIASTGNATDYGDLQYSAKDRSGAANSTRGLFSGGYSFISGANAYPRGIDYVTIASTGNASDFGDDLAYSSDGRKEIASCADETRALWAGGGTHITSAYSNFSYSTIATTGNASQFGDYIQTPSSGLSTRGGGEGVASDTRGVFAGDQNISSKTLYVTIMTTGNCVNFGDHNAVNFSGCGSFGGLS